MRLTTAVASALLSTAALVGHVHADEPASEAPSTTIDVPKPNFTPTKLKAPFLEQFTDDWEKRWTPSHAKKEDSSSEEDWAYVGNWAVEEPTVFGGIKGDKGLVVKNAAAHHAISAKFPKPIDNKGKPLVVQYEVKLQDMLSCGGAYMKLLRENKALHAEEFSNTTPYVIMFGPDRCGVTNKVHFIFKLKKQNSDEYQEHHMRLPPQVRVTKLSTLYTLVLNPDDSFKVLIDGEEVKNGTLFTEFTPAVIPMEEIDDPTDVKPEDWVDIMKIPDPDATKPDDWDENAPFEIPDEEATKPEDWLDDEPLTIPDPEAEKPEDWDDEEDGDWTAPSVPNPKCNEVSGCGPWEQPMKTNPDYKGPWNPPMIDNPEYKGPWSPRTIANPDYYDVPSPLVLDAMGAIGFEIWTMQSDILFDNIYIGNSLEDANALKAETFDIKRPIEAAQEEASKPKPEPAADEEIVSFKEDPVKHIRAKVDRFIALAQKSPIEAAKAVPDVAGALGALLVTLVLVIVGAVGSSTPAPAVVKKEAGKAKEAAEDAAKAVSTGAEKAKAEVTKRVTRSG